MSKVEYSEKQIVVFNGLIKLIQEGKNPYNIKVADIAKASNIGKGTIYDYFQSKEEAISKAILYYINMEIENTQKHIDRKELFKDKYYELLYNIKRNYENNMSVYNILLSSGGLVDFYEYLLDIDCDIEGIKNLIEDVMMNIIEAGIKEDFIDKDYDPYYLNMAIRGSIGGFSHYISKRNLYEDVDLERAMDVSYKILIKSIS